MRERLLFTVMLGLAAATAGCHPLTTPGDGGTGFGDGGTQQCGATLCGEGTECCNASCGICTPPGRVCIQLACSPATVGTTCAATTCLVGETCMETPKGAVCVPPEESPCNLVDCPPNAICQVLAGAASCAPVPVEPIAPVKDAGLANDAGPVVTPGTCALVLCAGICKDVPGGFICEPVPSRDAGPGTGSCAVTLCPPKTYCDDISGKAECIRAPSCDTVKCSAGNHCELQEVQCIRAPCPPQPSCVPDTVKDPCATVRCAAGTHCEAKQVQCIKAPCPPIAECVADELGTKCGKSTCGAGTYCCNSSCGICAPKNGACTQQYCGPTD